MIDTPEKQTTAPTPPEPQRTARTVWWIVGAACTGLVLLFGMAVAGVWIWTVASPEESDKRTETYTQAVSGVDAEVEVGHLEFTASADGTLVVDRETRWHSDEPATSESWSGDVFNAVGECDQRFFIVWGGDECEVNYAFAVPSGTAVTAENSVGDVVLDGVDGAIDVEASVGEIEGENLRATSTAVEASVGSVRLEYAEVRGDITVTADTGDVEILVPNDGTTYDIEFEAGVGSQDIDIDTSASQDADYVITVNTSVGDLTVRYAD
jgi:hypothetical protein